MQDIVLQGHTLTPSDIPDVMRTIMTEGVRVTIFDFHRAPKPLQVGVNSAIAGGDVKAQLGISVNGFGIDQSRHYSPGPAAEAPKMPKRKNPRPGCDCGGGHVNLPCARWCSLSR